VFKFRNNNNKPNQSSSKNINKKTRLLSRAGVPSSFPSSFHVSDCGCASVFSSSFRLVAGSSLTRLGMQSVMKNSLSLKKPRVYMSMVCKWLLFSYFCDFYNIKNLFKAAVLQMLKNGKINGKINTGQVMFSGEIYY